MSSTPPPDTPERRRIIGPAELSLGGGIILAVAFVFLTRVFDLRAEMVDLLQWIQAFGAAAVFVFLLVDILAVPLVLPTLPLTLGAGFIFGALPGTLLCLVARTLGGSISFLVARHLFSKRIADYVLSHEKLKIADFALGEDGGRIVFLTRLVPFFPGKLSNYFFGLTRCPLRGFFLGSFLGMIPITLANVYLGSLAGDLATLGARDAPRTPLQWVLDGGGLLAAVVAAVALARYAQTQLRRYREKSPATSSSDSASREDASPE